MVNPTANSIGLASALMQTIGRILFGSRVFVSPKLGKTHTRRLNSRYELPDSRSAFVCASSLAVSLGRYCSDHEASNFAVEVR